MTYKDLTQISLSKPDDRNRLVEQYKLMINTLDKNHANRDSTNNFYTSVNSFILSAATAINGLSLPHKNWLFSVLTLIGIITAYSWYNILGRLKKLDGLYGRILIDIETHMPAPVYKTVIYGGEKYEAPPGFITKQEMFIPILFVAVYIGNFIILGKFF